MCPSTPAIRITDPQDTQLAAYRTLAGQAVLGLIFGLLAPVAFVDPTLCAVPVLGVIFSAWALRRIAKNVSELTGRKTALAGLTLSLLFLAAAPAHQLVYQRIVCDEARQFASLWFKYLAQNEPHKAFQLTKFLNDREPLDDRLWDFYRDNPAERQGLEKFVNDPLIRTLLALGPKAQVRFYQTTKQWQEGGTDAVMLLYAVTYEEEGQRISFFVSTTLPRTTFPDGSAGWNVSTARGGVQLKHWQTDAA